MYYRFIKNLHDVKTYYEVLFQNDFNPCHPWGDAPLQWQFRHYNELLNITVPLHTLVHVTHNTEAQEIRREFMFQFQAKQKVGKRLSLAGGTFRVDAQEMCFDPNMEVYTPIPDTEPVFPGYYSWWGIDCSVIPDCAFFTSPHKIATALERLNQEGIRAYVPGYLKEDPESIYGNNAFSCNFRDLLKVYAASRHYDVRNICIRKGGTLRYRKEICYVLIICIDQDEEELSAYEVLQEEHQFQGKFHGLTTTNGSLLDYKTTPTFNPEYIITWANRCSDYSYETVAFAFYFPSEAGVLAINRRFCSEKEIMHKEERCIKKRPPKTTKWTCPNNC